jgi:hypothetical protein
MLIVCFVAHSAFGENYYEADSQKASALIQASQKTS